MSPSAPVSRSGFPPFNLLCSANFDLKNEGDSLADGLQPVDMSDFLEVLLLYFGQNSVEILQFQRDVRSSYRTPSRYPISSCFI